MSALTNKSVLILDDSRAMRDMLRTHLSNIGVSEVAQSDRVTDAIRAIRARTFSAILCDYNLGEGRNGQQFLEEARVTKIIRHSDVFVMVTAEKAYENVMAVAEYAPDDYLLKPFTADTLDKRLEKAFEKKRDLKGILLPLDREDFVAVIAACDRWLAASARHRPTVKRIRAEAYLDLERYEEAIRCYEDILHENPRAWAELGLGRALLHLGESERAKELFEHVSETFPTYLQSHEFLAEFHESIGNDKSAQAALEKAVEQSPLRMDRQGKLGEIAIRNSDLETAEKAFSKIVSHGAGSCFHNPEAYLRLAEINMKTGRAKKAAEVLDSLQKAIEAANRNESESAFKENPIADFCLAVGRTDGERLKGAPKESRKHFENALSLLSKNPGLPFPTNSLLRFVVDCLIFEKYDEAAKYVRIACENSNRRNVLKDAALGYCPDEPTKTKVRTIFIEMEDALKENYDRGIQLARKGDWEGAAKLATEAANSLPGNADAQLMASQLLLILIENT